MKKILKIIRIYLSKDTDMKSNASDIHLTFFGSGPVAADSLEFLAAHFTVDIIITKETSRKEMALLAPSASIYTVENKADLTQLIINTAPQTPVGVIVDFGIIVEKSVIDHFPKGIINSHFSLLPKWRGADPITFTVLNGEAKTGVSIMLINEKLDEGLLLSQQELAVGDQETTPSLTKKLITLSNSMLLSVIPLYLDGETEPYPQSNTSKATYSRKLTKQDGKLDWNKSATVLEKEIRAYEGWPKSYTSFKDIPVIITKAHKVTDSVAVGQIKVIDNQLIVGCQDSALAIDTLKPAGKKEMDSRAFLAGYRQKLGL